MKAVIWTKFGPPETLKFVDIPKPIPGDNDILIKVYATSVHRGDVRMRALDIPFPWWTKLFFRIFLGITLRLHPVLGLELSGKVVSKGKYVTNFKTGDEVFAEVSTSDFGGYAEYKCMKADGPIALKPKNLNYEQAAVIPAGGITALGMIKNAGINKNHKVLIYGASGSIGTFSIQICKHFGAFVTGVCSRANLKLVKNIGAIEAIDYQAKDFTKLTRSYDFVIDAVGKINKEQAMKVLKPGGVFIDVHKDSNNVKKKDFNTLLNELKEMCELGTLKPVIDKTFNINDIVAAHGYVDTGHKRGNVAVRVVNAF